MKNKSIRAIVKAVPNFTGNARIKESTDTKGLYFIIPSGPAYALRLIDSLRAGGYYCNYNASSNIIRASWLECLI